MNAQWIKFVGLSKRLMLPNPIHPTTALPKTIPNWMKVVGMLLCLCPLGSAYAEIHGTITGTTNYVWRMYSKSNDGPAIQGNLDYQHSSGVFLGATASNVNYPPSEQVPDIVFANSAQVEVAPYIGYTFSPVDDWRVDLQYSRYFYDGTFYEVKAEYNEFYFLLHYKDLISIQTSYIDDYYGLKSDALFTDLTARYPITDFLEVSGTFGHALTRSALETNYYYWNAGLTARYKFVQMDLRYHAAKEIVFLSDGEDLSPDHPETLKPTVVFSLSVGF